MKRSPLLERSKREYDELPARLRLALRFLLDHPDDVALHSMRSLARRAKLSAATMTRLVRRLGFENYEELRALHVAALRTGDSAAADRPRLQGEQALASDIGRDLGRRIADLCDSEMLDQLGQAATLLTRARRIYILGSQAAAGAATQMHHMLARLGDRALLLGSGTPGATGLEPLRHTTAADVLVAIGVEPYGRASLTAVRYVRGRGGSVVALTDSALSPLARDAQVVMVASKDGPSLFGTLVPLAVLVEIMVTLVARRAGARTAEALVPAEAQLIDLGELVERRAP